ncbi:hypothetical protein [Sphingobium sp. SA916]|uniref:hypothetical protein n=1 Tax=Sphingobium sp. SA916 TaxID=1851207 RepID=UPI000C9FB170|nr:hypothetical protein [Sphingobium sp. SA916]PNQ02135.1 hypothetical protein A8G00_14175 [Sphingobium sp. SA916]
MGITQGKMTEQERWATAAHLLEAHGDDVGNVVIRQIRELMDRGDQASAKDWIDISFKVQMLYGPEGDA